MTTYPIHTTETAPEGARQALRGLQEVVGMVPNLAATMANCPPLINAFVAASGQFQTGSLTDAERQVLLLTNAVANRCAWAVAFHSTLAIQEGVDPADVEAIRRGQAPAAPRLEALSALARTIIDKRGHLEDADVKAFTAEGFDDVHVLEVITGTAISAMANYAGNVAQPPLDAPFRAQAWSSEY
ncbi:MAG TPA: carboxymuconolactone decarboxylase family protein [Actinomycetes bacterium]|nr:carboxymuconolactone decarboxylase family protein [Actinomycetes bacterium]